MRDVLERAESGVFARSFFISIAILNKITALSPSKMPSLPPRAASIDIPALPLQLLLRREPTWAEGPAVVVADDRPQAEVLWSNAHARRLRIRPGITYAAAQSLDPHIHAGIVHNNEIDDAIKELLACLDQFSPRIEAATRPQHPKQQVEGTPGVFWADPTGMVPLFVSLEHWGESIRTTLATLGFTANVVVGFHRFRCYAIARTRQGVVVVDTPKQERSLAAAVPLDRLPLPAKARTALDRLDIHTLGHLKRLPIADLRARIGEAAAHLHTCLGDGWAPMQPLAHEDPVCATKQLEHPDDDRTRLLFALKTMLHDLMGELADRHQAMTSLRVHLRLDHAEPHEQHLEPAEPTLDEKMVAELLRLRLESLSLRAPVEEIELELFGTRATPGQLALFRTRARRDLAAGSRALAKIRAWLGPQAVVRPRIHDAHLPEAQFSLEPTITISFPRPRPPDPPPNPDEPAITRPARLARRVLARPRRIPAPPRHEPESWLGHRGPVRSIQGPHRISGGWWSRTVERDYYYVETYRGQILWVFYDRVRRHWYLHGWVD